MRRFIAMTICTLLTAACGGGGDEPAPGESLSGVSLQVSATITPERTTSQAVEVVATVSVTVASVTPGPNAVIPYTLRRITSGGQSVTGDVTLYPAGMALAGTLTATLPAGQPVGDQTYCLLLRPADRYPDWSGFYDGEVCGSVTITR